MLKYQNFECTRTQKKITRDSKKKRLHVKQKKSCDTLYPEAYGVSVMNDFKTLRLCM